ncbi:uncharacterized protein LOC124278320 isoform X2 [Haliotis rubra]|uniref:uncharacterized protein LOC124278320 isoform X2 n=1 Tax=Haliotis rubra TaxID=36100 RepID=UPI001EE626EE|nr:uncharacterized protein LOC124278320 isoform X2 [Haliotis rubra]
MMYTLFAVLLSLSFMGTCLTHEVTVEFDKLTLTNCRLRNRADASNKKTVVLYNTESLTYDMCLTKEKTFRLDKLRYSNDGLKDLITFSVNDREVGRVETRELDGNGELWNDILEVVNIGVEKRLAAGNYSLTVTAEHADLYGVELDSLTFSFDGASPDDNSQCTATQDDASAALLGRCFPELQVCNNPPSLPNADLTSEGQFVGARATYTCRPGFLFCGRSSKHRCSSTGEWNGLNGQCNRALWINPSVNFEAAIPCGMTVGSRVEIIATPTASTRFEMVLLSDNSVILNMDVRFNNSSKQHNIYLSGQKVQTFPFAVGTAFRAEIARDIQTYKVSLDGNFVCEQPDNFPDINPDRLIINNDISIQEVKYIRP